MNRKLLSRVGLLILIHILSFLAISAVVNKSASAQTLEEYGVVDKNKVEDAIEYAEWIDAAHIKVRFKNGKELVFDPSKGLNDKSSDLRTERVVKNGLTRATEQGYKNVTPSFGCYAAIKFQTGGSSFEKQSTQLDEVEIDIDFRRDIANDCANGNTFTIKPRNPERSIAYFKWLAPNQIGTVDGKEPGNFTKVDATAIINGVTYDVFLSDNEASATTCRNKLILNRANNEIMWYQLGSSDGKPPEAISTTCGYNDEDDSESFPRNNYLWKLANRSDDVSDIPPSDGTPVDESNQEAPSCTGSIDNGFGWIICPALDGIDALISTAESFIEKKLIVDTSTFEGSELSGLRNVWTTMARFASGILVIVALIMIISTVLDAKIFSNYTIKKTLPNIVIAAVGIWLSWTLLVNYVELVNDIGRGIASIMYTAVPEAKTNTLRDIVAISANKSGVVTDGAAGALFGALAIGAVFSSGIVGLLSVALTLAVAIIVGVFVLAVREMLIIVGVTLAPIAIAAWILPNTKKMWSFWFSTMNKLLLMYPIIAVLFAGSKIMSSISARAAQDNDGALEMLFPIIIYALPFFFLPKVFKSTGSILNGVTNAANKASSKATGGWRNTLSGAKEARNKTRQENKLISQRNRQINGVSVLGQSIPGTKSFARAGARMRSGQPTIPINADSRAAAKLAGSRATQAAISDTVKQIDETIGGDVDARKAIASGLTQKELETSDPVLASRMKQSGSARFLGDTQAQAAATLSLAAQGRASGSHIARMAKNFEGDRQTASALVQNAIRSAKGSGQVSIGAMKYDYASGEVGYEQPKLDSAGNVQLDNSGKIITEINTDDGTTEYKQAMYTQTLKAVAEMSATDKASLAVTERDDGSGGYVFKDTGLREAFEQSSRGSNLAGQILNDPNVKLTEQQRQALSIIAQPLPPPTTPGTPPPPGTLFPPN